MNQIQAHDHIIIGLGEVGSAIAAVFPLARVVDKEKGEEVDFKLDFKVMHICIPYSEKFVESVKHYQEQYNPEITIVHSTVPVGTCIEIGDVVHSPIRGVHPNLENGIRTFVKYFGGSKAVEAAYLFAQQGIKVKTVLESRVTEALKLWDTTQYGILIMLEKEIKRYCEQQNLDFDVIYTDANQTYNEGYSQLGKENVVRPFLQHMDGKIGGHCIIPNAEMLASPSAEKLVNDNSSL